MKVLFVSNTAQPAFPYNDASVRYRCYNFALDLHVLGHVADVISLSNFSLDLVPFYDVVVVHRPPYTDQMKALVDCAKKAQVALFASYDDLIFCEEYALFSSAYQSGRVKEEKIKDVFDRNEQALRLFDRVLVSTKALQDKAIESHPTAEVSVLYNGLQSSFVQKARSFPKRAKADRRYIAYFSGSKSHDKDFALVAAPLSQLLDKGKGQLFIVGELSFDETLNHIYHPSVPYNELPRLIHQSDINIAPLEKSVFNECKSGLKFYEAALLGVPSIVSPTQGMLRFQESEALLYADDESEWIAHCERLLDDTPFYEGLAKRAYDYASEECLSMTQTKKFLELI